MAHVLGEGRGGHGTSQRICQAIAQLVLRGLALAEPVGKAGATTGNGIHDGGVSPAVLIHHALGLGRQRGGRGRGGSFRLTGRLRLRGCVSLCGQPGAFLHGTLSLAQIHIQLGLLSGHRVLNDDALVTGQLLGLE